MREREKWESGEGAMNGEDAAMSYYDFCTKGQIDSMTSFETVKFKIAVYGI